MDTIMKADIFFFVTTVAVVAMTICLIFALYYVIRILRNVDEISAEVREEGELLREDIRDLRTNIREEGLKVKHIANFFGKFGSRRSQKAKDQKSKE